MLIDREGILKQNETTVAEPGIKSTPGIDSVSMLKKVRDVPSHMNEVLVITSIYVPKIPVYLLLQSGIMMLMGLRIQSIHGFIVCLGSLFVGSVQAIHIMKHMYQIQISGTKAELLSHFGFEQKNK